MKSSNKTIVKNTLFLYFRMLFIMIVALYTSRVILEILGINDFGIYQTVGGVVGMLSFLNSALSSGSSRFLMFELGSENFEKLRRTFCTTLNIHIFLAIIVFILAETIGLWFVYNKLTIPQDRFFAALWVYEFSTFTAVIAIIQIPYVASIIAHERMKIFAYISIVEVSSKLLIVYMLVWSNIDKLVLYAILLFIIQVALLLFYIFYCFLAFKETPYKFIIDKSILKYIVSFSGWSLFSNFSIALNNQGTTIITNMFFGPAVVTARALSTQVAMAANQFVNNFRLAVNPQIVKRYAACDYEGSKSLLLESTKYSFFLMLFLGLPIVFFAEPLLKLWLVEVPEYTVIFLQLVIIQSLFATFDASFFIALYAKGRLRENALMGLFVGIIQFSIIYLFFKYGFSPVTLSYVGIVTYFLLGIVIKPVLICKLVDYTYKDILKVLIPCFKVLISAAILPAICYYYLDASFLNYSLILFVSLISNAVTIWFLGINSNQREMIFSLLKRKFNFK